MFSFGCGTSAINPAVKQDVPQAEEASLNSILRKMVADITPHDSKKIVVSAIKVEPLWGEVILWLRHQVEERLVEQNIPVVTEKTLEELDVIRWRTVYERANFALFDPKTCTEIGKLCCAGSMLTVEMSVGRQNFALCLELLDINTLQLLKSTSAKLPPYPIVAEVTNCVQKIYNKASSLRTADRTTSLCLVKKALQKMEAAEVALDTHPCLAQFQNKASSLVSRLRELLLELISVEPVADTFGIQGNGVTTLTENQEFLFYFKPVADGYVTLLNLYEDGRATCIEDNVAVLAGQTIALPTERVTDKKPVAGLLVPGKETRDRYIALFSHNKIGNLDLLRQENKAAEGKFAYACDKVMHLLLNENFQVYVLSVLVVPAH
jgi:hypothetical protein